MNQSSQIFESYVPVYDACPENWEEARQFLVEQLKKVSNAVNIREIGWFLDEELLSGKQFIPSSTSGITQGTEPQYRTVFRKVIDTGVLPNNTIKFVPHGLTITDDFTLVQMYGAATKILSTGTFYGIPMPFNQLPGSAIPGSVELEMGGTNIRITTNADMSEFTRSFVTIEYLLEI